MTGTAILQSIIEILYGALTEGAQKLGAGISSFVQNMFFTLNTEGAISGLSAFGIIVCVFAGIALTVGIGRLIYRLLSSFGGSR